MNLVKYRGAIALCATILLNSMGQGATAPSLPLFAREFGVSVVLASLAVVMFPMGRLVMSIPGGILSQRFGRRPVLITSMSVVAVGAILAAFSHSFEELLIFRILSGLGGGAFVVTATIYLRDISTAENRARYQSLNPMSILIGISLGALAGGWLADTMNFRAPFYLQMGTALVAIVVIGGFIPETRGLGEDRQRISEKRDGATEGKRSLLTGLLRSPGFIVVALFSLWVVGSRQGARFSVMPLFAQEKGFSPKDLGVFFLFTHVPQFFAVIVAGILADRFGRKIAIIPAATIFALGVLIFIAGSSYGILLLSGVLLGLGEGLAGPPTVAYFADKAPRGLEALTMGLYGTVGGAGALLGALILGFISDTWGFGTALFVDALVLLVLALSVIVIARESHQKDNCVAAIFTGGHGLPQK